MADKKSMVALAALALLAAAFLYFGGHMPFQICSAPYGTPLSDWINGGSGTIEYVGGRDLAVWRFTCTDGGYPTTTFCYITLLGGQHADSPPNDYWIECGGEMKRLGESYYANIAPNQMARMWFRYYTTCGNAVCDTSFSETATSCPSDCGAAVTTTTVPITPPGPPILPDPLAWIRGIVAALLDWLRSLFWTFQVLTTAPNYKVGDVANFTVNIPLTAIDSDYADGTYQRRYGLWFVTDSAQNIKNYGTWDEVSNSYVKTVQMTAPAAGEYYFVALVNQYDYVATASVWNSPQPVTVAKEAVKFTTYTLTPPTPPVLPDIVTWLAGIITGLFSWLKALFGL